MTIDSVQRFIFENQPIRGEVVHLDSTYNTIIAQRDYPPVVRQWLGEALVAAVLLSSSIKYEGTLSMQFQGSEALSMLLVQVDNHLNIRATAKYKEGKNDARYQQAFLNGQMVMTVQAEQQSQTYQSIIPLHSCSLSENIAHYFAQSEQIATRIWLACGSDKAAGMLLQLLPGENSLEKEHFWEYALAMGASVSDAELLELDNATLLHRLYHESTVRIFEPRAAQFKCRCDTERMNAVLRALGKEDVNALLAEKKILEIRCEFCNQLYRFDSIDAAMLFDYKA